MVTRITGGSDEDDVSSWCLFVCCQSAKRPIERATFSCKHNTACMALVRRPAQTPLLQRCSAGVWQGAHGDNWYCFQVTGGSKGGQERGVNETHKSGWHKAQCTKPRVRMLQQQCTAGDEQKTRTLDERVVIAFAPLAGLFEKKSRLFLNGQFGATLASCISFSLSLSLSLSHSNSS